MRETGFLNNEISDAIARLGHMDELIICDAGFSVPVNIPVIDISINENQPTTLQVLIELLKHFSVERIVLAEETKQHSPTMFARLTSAFDKCVVVETIPHSEFKERSHYVKAIVRTGDFTAYSNILLVSAGGSRWFVEKE